jgi:hypothetical protein
VNHFSITFSYRTLVVLLGILLALLLLTVFILGHAHLGAIHTFAQSTDSILD